MECTNVVRDNVHPDLCDVNGSRCGASYEDVWCSGCIFRTHLVVGVQLHYVRDRSGSEGWSSCLQIYSADVVVRNRVVWIFLWQYFVFEPRQRSKNIYIVVGIVQFVGSVSREYIQLILVFYSGRNLVHRSRSSLLLSTQEHRRGVAQDQ